MGVWGALNENPSIYLSLNMDHSIKNNPHGDPWYNRICRPPYYEDGSVYFDGR
jgi:hypothetical protein